MGHDTTHAHTGLGVCTRYRRSVVTANHFSQAACDADSAEANRPGHSAVWRGFCKGKQFPAPCKFYQVWAAQVPVHDGWLAAVQEHHPAGNVSQHVQPARSSSGSMAGQEAAESCLLWCMRNPASFVTL